MRTQLFGRAGAPLAAVLFLLLASTALLVPSASAAGGATAPNQLHYGDAYSLAPGSTPLATASPQNAYTCSYGTATSSVCPQVHWANSGYTHPQVYIVDQAQAAWPVSAAASTWDQASNINAYASTTCPGYRGTHCVYVYDGNYGATGWIGYTSYSWDGSYNLIDGSVTIYLNDYYGLNAYGHRQSACHEMGHALGLGHNSSTNSCLYPVILNSSGTIYPNGYDLAMLNSIYSVSH